MRGRVGRAPTPWVMGRVRRDLAAEFSLSEARRRSVAGAEAVVWTLLVAATKQTGAVVVFQARRAGRAFCAREIATAAPGVAIVVFLARLVELAAVTADATNANAGLAVAVRRAEVPISTVLTEVSSTHPGLAVGVGFAIAFMGMFSPLQGGFHRPAARVMEMVQLGTDRVVWRPSGALSRESPKNCLQKRAPADC